MLLKPINIAGNKHVGVLYTREATLLKYFLSDYWIKVNTKEGKHSFKYALPEGKKENLSFQAAGFVKANSVI